MLEDAERVSSAAAAVPEKSNHSAVSKNKVCGSGEGNEVVQQATSWGLKQDADSIDEASKASPLVQLC